MTAGGVFSWTPSEGQVGTHTFDVVVTDSGVPALEDRETVSVTVSEVNVAPVARDDGYVTGDEVMLVVPSPGVLVNDDDPDGGLLTASKVSDPSNGVVTLNADGSFTYSAAPGFSGLDSFSYVANDGVLDSNVAIVEITVGSALVEQGAVSEVTLAGSISSGGLVDTLGSDDVYEVLLEEVSKGNPASRTSSLDHWWRFDVPSSDSVTVVLEAHHSAV